jgi:hypothetical protein
MLLIKCPQCSRSYRLAESLFQRKAAGYGVVITCRNCKTQIHVDQGAVTGTNAEASDASQDWDEITPPSRSGLEPVELPAASAPESEPPPSSGQAMPLVVKPPVQPVTIAAADQEDAVTLPPAAPDSIDEEDAIIIEPLPSMSEPNTVAVPPRVMTSTPAAAPFVSAAPRPASAAPRPGAQRPLASATATPTPLRATTGSATATPLPVRPATTAFSAAPRPSGNAAPPRPSGSATGTPLPVRPTLAGSATGTPLPVRPTLGGSATGTPLPVRAASATGTPLPVRAASATGTPLPVRTAPLASNGARAHAPNAPAPTPTPNDSIATPATTGVAGDPALPSDPGVTPTPNRSAAKAKLVALSPGLLGVSTALKEPLTPMRDADSAPISTGPLSIPDAELFDVDSKPPDSAVPIESVDYLESLRPPPVAPRAPEPENRAAPAKQTGKRLPAAPPHPPHPQAPQPPAPPLAAAPEQRRQRQPSGDLSEDFLSTDLGFDAAPAIAPPDAAALMRRPLSSRPAPAVGAAPLQTSTRAPVSKPSGAASEKKSGGRAVLFLLVAAAFGGGGYFWMHRLQVPAEEAAVAQNTPVTTPPADSPAAPAVAPSATTTETATAAPEAAPTPAASATAAAENSPAATAPATGTAAAAVAPASEKIAKSRADKPAHDSGSSSAPAPKEAASPAAKAEVAAPAPTSNAAIEPRGPVGTEPFDVAAARSALEMSAEMASNCRKGSDPSGVAVITITFSQTGRVTSANISGPPFQATPTGGCIASTMRKTRVPPFAGDMVTVRKTVTIQ